MTAAATDVEAPGLLRRLLGWLFSHTGRHAYPLYFTGAIVIAAMAGSWYLTVNWQIEANLFPETFQDADGRDIHSIGQYFAPARLVWWGALGVLILLAALLISARRPDVPPALAPAICFLSVFSVVVLLRLAPTLGWVRQSPFLRDLVTKHLVWTVLGMGMMLLLSGIIGRWLLALGRRFYWILALAGCAVTVATLVFGTEIHGHRLWLQIAGFSFQPVEFVKIGFVIAVSAALTTWEWGSDGSLDSHAAPSFLRRTRAQLLGLIVAGIMIAPVAVQRDFGPVFQLLLVLSTMLLVGGGSWVLPVAVMGGVIGAGSYCYHLGWPTVVRARVNMWLDPFSHSEQITQSIWSIAEGGFFGVGLGRGGAHYIPVVHCDFIPALLAEEFGFLGMLGITAIYAVIARCGFIIARDSASNFAASTAVGLTTLIMSQVVLLCAGVSGMMPLTGVTLPFISAGGSSVLASFVVVGLLVCLAAQTVREEPDRKPKGKLSRKSSKSRAKNSVKATPKKAKPPKVRKASAPAKKKKRPPKKEPSRRFPIPGD